MTPWREKTLGEFVSLQRGHDLPIDNRGEGRVPVVGSFGITGYHDKARTKGPGVTVGRSGASAGTVFFINEDFWPHNTCLFVTDFQGNHPRFAYYLLSTLDLPSHAAGSAQPSLNRNHISPLPIRVPERTEQDRIVRVLSSLDDKIELNRRMNETLEAVAQAIFKDWFVTFGPVRRKQEGATDPIAVLGGLIPDTARAADTAALFPESLGDDGLPKGWNTYALQKLATLSKASVSPSKTPEQVFEHHSLPAYDKGEEPVAETGGTILSNKFLVPPNSVLLSKLNPEISRVWVPSRKASHAQIASTEFLVLVPKQGFGQSLLCAIFRDPTFRAGLEGMVTGTSKSHQRISPPALMAKEIVIGESAAFNEFENIAAPLLEKRLGLRAENRTLAETRDYLLPKLMSGEVRVRDSRKVVS